MQFLFQRRLPSLKTVNISKNDCAEALRVGRNEELEPVATINAGLDTLIINFKGQESVLSLTPNIDELKNFRVLHNIDIILVIRRK